MKNLNYEKIFKKCGLMKCDEEVVEEYRKGGFDVAEVWCSDDGIEFAVEHDGTITESCYRGSREVTIERIKWLFDYDIKELLS